MFSVIDNNEVWNKYVAQNASTDGGFLQSWEWGEFQKAYGRKVRRAAMSENNEIICGWQIIEMALPLGLKYWYAPRPVRNQEFFFKKIYDFAKKEKAVFIRIDSGGDGLENLGFKKVDVFIQPQEELIIDIRKSEEQLLSEMKPKTRYNIRVAEKHGVIVEIPAPPVLLPGGERVAVGRVRGIDEFFHLIEKTSERQGIRPHPKEYYKKMLEVLGKDGAAKFYTARYQGKIIAANLMTYFGKTAAYLHGGTDDAYKNVMAPHLLQWQAMRDAKKGGYEYYNFGGVSGTKKTWEGITRFKTGFCPTTEFVKYGGVWDLPVNTIKYGVYRLAKRLW